MTMPRVLINQHMEVAIEVSRKDKWSVLVLGWTPTHRAKMLNSIVDRDWQTYDVPLTSAIWSFLYPKLKSSTIDDTARRELEELLKNAG